MTAAIKDAITLDAGEAIEKYRLVYLSGDREAKKCNTYHDPVGVWTELTASGDPGSACLLSNAIVAEIMVDGAISQNAKVFVGQGGKGTAAAVGKCLGRALEASTADGDVIQVLLTGGEADPGDVITLEDDFFDYVATEGWTLVASDSGTATDSDAKGGVLDLDPSDGTEADNDESYLHSTNEVFLVTASKPIYFQARITQTEANTDDANWIVGLSDTVAADFLQDDGAGPAASYDGLVFFKVDGGTKVLAESSNAGSQTTTGVGANTNTGADVTSGTQMKLEIVCVPTSATEATVYFLVNGTLIDTHTITITGMAEMHVVFGAKNGGAAAENLLIDYVLVKQAR